MSKTKIFRVVNGRVHFKCHSCQGKRMVAIPPGVRRRSIRCQKCGEITSCNFNRRLVPREQQRGKVLLSISNNIVIEVDLYDISNSGIGFDVAARDIRKISVGAEVQFRCTWNSKLFAGGRYVITSVKGRRIGAQRNQR
ncbi:MAG: hypothetical protein GY799_08845 [Desulfobulbaceae bacterium]|nr:hypothetical protein [Desulfobulbaceae bacterium]